MPPPTCRVVLAGNGDGPGADQFACTSAKRRRLLPGGRRPVQSRRQGAAGPGIDTRSAAPTMNALLLGIEVGKQRGRGTLGQNAQTDLYAVVVAALWRLVPAWPNDAVRTSTASDRPAVRWGVTPRSTRPGRGNANRSSSALTMY